MLSPDELPRPRRGLPSLLASARRFRAAQSGIAAVEFALILPVMVLLFIGITEVTIGLNTDRKLTLLSRSLADLTARASIMSKSDIGNIFAAATAMLQPYDSSPASMVVTSIQVTLGAGGTPVGSVAWSCAQTIAGAPIAKRPKGSLYLVPAGFKNASSFILAETSYKYVPLFGGRFTPGGTINLSETTPWPVRNANEVTWDSNSPPC